MIDRLVADHRQALATDPENVVLLSNLGALLLQLGRAEESAMHVRKALALAPGTPEVLLNIGDIERFAGRHVEAALDFRRVLALRPGFPEAWNNLGISLLGVGDIEAATACFATAVEARGDYAEALNNLGNAFHRRRRLEDAGPRYRRASCLQPEIPAVHMNLGNLAMDRGEPRTAVRNYRRSLALAAASAVHTNLIFALDFLPEMSVADHQTERRKWAAAYAAPRPIEPHANDRDPSRRLRLGFVSADFREHSAASIFGPIIRRLDRRQFEIVGYSAVVREDGVTAVFRQACDLWRPVAALADDAVARAIREDRVDIVVDLSGHSGGNRLLALAQKPAPVQVTGWGHAAGTGLAAIDYLVSDRVLIPDDVRGLFAEAIYDLACFMTFEPPADAPALPVPSATGRSPTFGCFNRALKIGREVIPVWRRILAAVPGSRLLLKDSAFDDGPSRDRVLALLASHGVRLSDVEVRGRTPRAEHLAALSEVDVALDPFPQNGGVSTCEALYMDVPVVALLGRMASGRASAAILAATGLDHLIARDADAYVEIAVALARSAARPRGVIRESLMRSDAGDPDRYARAVAEAFRDMWRRWCAGTGPYRATL